MRRIHTRQNERERRIAPFLFPNQFPLPHAPPRRTRRASLVRRADRKPLLQPERRLANRTLLHGGDEIQYVAAGLAGETVKRIFARTGAEGILALRSEEHTSELQSLRH